MNVGKLLIVTPVLYLTSIIASLAGIVLIWSLPISLVNTIIIPITCIFASLALTKIGLFLERNLTNYLKEMHKNENV